MQSNKQLVKYTNNEAYFDVIEEVDAIIDKQGATVSAEIHGYIGELFYLPISLSIYLFIYLLLLVYFISYLFS